MTDERHETVYRVRMMPGQTTYTPQELDRLYGLVAEAADGDPGEADEASADLATAREKPL